MATAAKKTEKKSSNGEVKPLTKTQIITNVAETTSLSKKEVGDVIEAFTEEIKKSIGKKGAGSFTLPGVLKIEKKYVAATKEKKHIENRLKPGTFFDRPAKPAHYKVKIRALKTLKEWV
ncbi:MAG: HU family DNA-binding protein [Planctomycetaceae bacterium]|jgi:nucleoid DNA-binding protein|nr:HU family DNA-binding protein [Planctomycetaceae bacterium]